MVERSDTASRMSTSSYFRVDALEASPSSAVGLGGGNGGDAERKPGTGRGARLVGGIDFLIENGRGVVGSSGGVSSTTLGTTESLASIKTSRQMSPMHQIQNLRFGSEIVRIFIFKVQNQIVS